MINIFKRNLLRLDHKLVVMDEETINKKKKKKTYQLKKQDKTRSRIMISNSLNSKKINKKFQSSSIKKIINLNKKRINHLKYRSKNKQ